MEASAMMETGKKLWKITLFAYISATKNIEKNIQFRCKSKEILFPLCEIAYFTVYNISLFCVLCACLVHLVSRERLYSIHNLIQLESHKTGQNKKFWLFNMCACDAWTISTAPSPLFFQQPSKMKWKKRWFTEWVSSRHSIIASNRVETLDLYCIFGMTQNVYFSFFSPLLHNSTNWAERCLKWRNRIRPSCKRITWKCIQFNLNNQAHVLCGASSSQCNCTVHNTHWT